MEIDLRSLATAMFMDKVGDGRHDAGFIENWRPAPWRSIAGPQNALVGAWSSLHRKPSPPLGVLVLQVIESLKLHDRPGQLLGKFIMDFVSDELPFVVAGLEHVPHAIAIAAKELADRCIINRGSGIGRRVTTYCGWGREHASMRGQSDRPAARNWQHTHPWEDNS